ncbi:hypothetical protein AMR41_14045 [Hapalosiphon sp. MRB220]|nr:hypothetical protein AMR41_14045 [Hapalosiphon sp. MRB220]
MKILERLQYKLFQQIEPFLFSSFFIKYIDSSYNNQSPRLISVAIPHYNRGKSINETLKNILKDSRIDEIVILDDGSKPEEFNLLVENLSRFGGKIKLFRREQNIGSFGTKVQVVSLCSNEWVILLDSDNSLFRKYIDSIFKIPNWEDDKIYCSDFAYPCFNFQDLSGKVIDFQQCSQMDLKRFGAFINDGNFFLNKTNYLKALLPYIQFIPFGACSFFSNYIWLSAGNKLEVLCNAPYYHRVQADGIWVNTKSESIRIAELLEDMLIRGIRADKDTFTAKFQILSKTWLEPNLISLHSV